MTTKNKSTPAPPQKNISVKIFGVGGAGANIVQQMIAGGFPADHFAVLNTDARSLTNSTAAEKIQLETKRLQSSDSADPERGQSAVAEHLPKLKAWCEGADVVFIVAGLGGRAGTGISPLLARVAKEAGALVLGFVALPFDCEGSRRQQNAQDGLEQLKAAADGVICLPNQKILKLIDENTSLIDTFKISNGLLTEGVRGIWQLLNYTGLIEIHFADLCAMVRDRHAESSFAAAEASGPNRSREVMEKLLAHPMLDGGQMLIDAEAVLVSLMSGPGLTMAEVNRVMEQINRQCENAQVIMGAAIDEAFRDRLAVTIVATRRNPQSKEGSESPLLDVAQDEVEPRSPATDAELHERLLGPTESTRPASRFVPPPPELTPEKMQELQAKRTAASARQRKNAAKMRQGQLPLEIVSKGRFDKSEPTIHKGEDLDVPTYIRRGVALN